MSQPNHESASLSLQGNRKLNQDKAILVESENTVLMVIADGMGGHPKGEVAAQIVIDTCVQLFNDVSKPIADPEQFLAAVFHQAHLAIIDYGQRQAEIIDPRTTAVITLIQNNIVDWAHIGDSRFYLFRGDKRLVQTIDHSYVEQLRQDGLISNADMTVHPQRNYVTRSLGGIRSRLDISHGKPTALLAGDILLICSDGLWAQIDDKTLDSVINEPFPMSRITNLLAHKAEAQGFPESDNVTLTAIRWLNSAESDLLLKRLNLNKLQDNHPLQQTAPNDNIDNVLDDLRESIENFEIEMQEEHPKE